MSGFNPTNIVQVQLPAGRYVLNATVTLDNTGGSDQNFGCEIDVNYNDSFSGAIDSNSIRIPIDYPENSLTVLGTVYYTQTGYAVVNCNTYNGDAAARLTAIKVDNLH